MKAGGKRPAPGFPSRQQIIDFITASPDAAGKREIGRAFGLHGSEKIKLKALLKDMTDEGLIDMEPGRAFHKHGGLPHVTVLRVVDVSDGQVWASPEHWEAEGIARPRVRVVERGRRNALAIGDRMLARTEEAGNGAIAHIMKMLAKADEQMLGVVAIMGGHTWLKPVDKRTRHATRISDCGTAEAGDLVLAERSGRGTQVSARVSEVLGDAMAPRAFSLIAIHKYSIPDAFSSEALREAEQVARLRLEGTREDLRHLPIIAIDPSDARDHDDAIWAEPREDGGFNAIVAIADVSFYVRSGSALDKEARRRGNSVYFPDRVVPMLPEILSADVCSLRAGTDKAALVCHLSIDSEGMVTSQHFRRAIIRVAANLSYEDAQGVMDGAEHEHRPPLSALMACWQLLRKGRDKRAPLALDLPERRVELDEQGRISGISLRITRDSNRLIEDFMIAANVAAAKALEAKRTPVIYRAHEPPAREKLEALKDYLATFEIAFTLGQVITPAVFNRIIERIGDHEARSEIMEQVLRTQTQAYYTPQHVGHFGLALGSYAHFTSPIRRYADVLVHRALVRSYNLGEGGLSNDDEAKMAVTATTISALERRAMEAERETLDRYIAAHLESKVGEVLDTRITGVTKFGFFATIEGLGGDGLVPAATLGNEYFDHDPTGHRLVGQTSGEEYKLGQRLRLRLAEADPISGAIKFELPEGANHLPFRGNRNGSKRPKPSARRGRT